MPSLRPPAGALNRDSLLRGEDLEGAALELLPRGLNPLGTRKFFWGVGAFPADTSCVVDRPPTHFFVKKKFSPTCGAGAATQKVPSVFWYARDFLFRVKHCATLGGFIPSLRGNPCAAQESTPHAGGSFFLYVKSGLRESDCLRGRKPEVCTDSTPPLFRP